MRGNLNIFRSKFIVIFILITLMVCLITGVVTYWSISGGHYSGSQMEELTGTGAETIFPIGRYSDIRIADAENGIFLVREGGAKGTSDWSYILVNEKGRKLADTQCSTIRKQVGNYFVMQVGRQDAFVNPSRLIETGETLEIYTDVEIHPSGEYVLLARDGKSQITDMEGKVLYEGTSKAYLVNKKGYVIQPDEEGVCRIINFVTGKTEYTAPEGVKVDDYHGGMWFMDCSNEVNDGVMTWMYGYMLDDNYNVTADGAIYTAHNIAGENSQEYVSIQKETDVDYDTRHELLERKVIRGAERKIYSHGELALDGSADDTHFRYIYGDILATSDFNEKLIDYIDLTTGETVIADSEILSFMDLEDGVAVACICPETQDTDDRTGELLSRPARMDKFKWGLWMRT